MQARGRADVDEVEVAGEEILQAGDSGGDAELAGDGRGAPGVDVAEDGDLVEVGERLVALDVRGADAGADDADRADRPGRRGRVVVTSCSRIVGVAFRSLGCGSTVLQDATGS